MRRTSRNTFRINAEVNRAGRYELRVEARYAGTGWCLRVFFVASTPERLLSRLQSALRYLQRREEELWLWGSNASDRSLLFEELMHGAGVELDRRSEFPRAGVVLRARPGAAFRPLQLAEVKRKLLARLAPRPRVATTRRLAIRSSA
ncbi:MAG: hypothetical protein ACE5IP_02875 [Terriglobia bacterium]